MSSQVFIANEMLATNEISNVENGDESIEKYGKLLKTEKLSKSQKLSKTRKLFKFQKSAKLRKKLTKSQNLSNFDAKKYRSRFLILSAKTVFNYL